MWMALMAGSSGMRAPSPAIIQSMKNYSNRKYMATGLCWGDDHADCGLDGPAPARGGTRRRGAAGAQKTDPAPAAVRHGHRDVHGTWLRRRTGRRDRASMRGVGEDGVQLLPDQGIPHP